MKNFSFLLKQRLLFFLLWSCCTQATLALNVERDSLERKAIVHVSVIPMDEKRVLEDQTVVIKGEKIVHIGPAENTVIPDSTFLIDGAGKFLMPGLIDMHAHIDYNRRGEIMADGLLFVNYGVTTLLNLSGGEDELKVRDSIRNRVRNRIEPDLYTAGWFINVPYFSTPDEVEAEVRKQKELGFDVIKMHGNLSPKAFDRLHQTAKALDIKVIGHAPRNLGMAPVYEHKQALAHAEEYFYTEFSPVGTLLWKITFFSGIVMLFFFIIAGMAHLIVWAIAMAKKRSLPLSWAVYQKQAGIYTILALLFFAGYVFIIPPAAPFLLEFPLARPTLAILSVLLLILSMVLIHRTYLLFKLSKMRSFTKGYLLVAGALIISFTVFSFYWVTLTWRTTDENVERIAQQTAAAGIWVTPNMVAYHYISSLHRKENIQKMKMHPDLKYLTRWARDGWMNHSNPGITDFIAPGFALQENLMQKLVGHLHQQGVPLLAGSDVGLWWVFPGISLHEELELLVAAGLSPYEALKTATVNGARFLEREDEFGKIAEGMRADGVLLKENPLNDIQHTRSIDGVMLRGKWLSRHDLNEMLAALAASRK